MFLLYGKRATTPYSVRKQPIIKYLHSRMLYNKRHHELLLLLRVFCCYYIYFSFSYIVKRFFLLSISVHHSTIERDFVVVATYFWYFTCVSMCKKKISEFSHYDFRFFFFFLFAVHLASHFLQAYLIWKFSKKKNG